MVSYSPLCPPKVRLGLRALAAGNGADTVQEHRQTVVDAMCLSDRGVVRGWPRRPAKPDTACDDALTAGCFTRRGHLPAPGATRYDPRVLLYELVTTSAAVAGASSRLVKIAELAALLQRVTLPEVDIGLRSCRVSRGRAGSVSAFRPSVNRNRLRPLRPPFSHSSKWTRCSSRWRPPPGAARPVTTPSIGDDSIRLSREADMTLTQLFIAELEREAPRTRRALEQVPVDHDDWTPHP